MKKTFKTVREVRGREVKVRGYINIEADGDITIRVRGRSGQEVQKRTVRISKEERTAERFEIELEIEKIIEDAIEVIGIGIDLENIIEGGELII